MKKSIKKVVSLLLTLVCLMSCFSTVTVFAKDGAITDHQAVVLVLDTSGSMGGTPIANLKKAALEFCNKIIGADPNNQIAIVTFADRSKTSDFSNNLAELARTISAISASGGTEMADAIRSADTLLQKDTLNEGYVKSIVIMADGEPWDDSETVQAATALFSKYNMYSIGFFEYENESAKNLLKNIQNCGYYEANDVDALIDEFVKIATDILNPFTIKLSHNNIGKSENEENPGSYTYKYEITAEIINGNSKQANNVKVSIDLGQGMVLSSGNNQIIEVGTLGAGETKTLTWNIEMPMVVLGVTMYDIYSVTASSDNTVDITASDKIIISDDDDYNKKNNELDFNKDIWRFANYTVDKEPLTTEDYNALMHGQSNTYKQYLNDVINSKQGGQCYGMAATTVLSKMNIINIANLQENANCLHDVKKNEKAKSLIGYYHVFSKLTFQDHETGEDLFLWNLESKTDREKLSTISSLAQNVKNGGNPFILRFELPNDNGHAVVAYAYEAGNFRKNGRSYSHRILIYDNNYPKWNENSCLYYNLGDNSWCIPNYKDALSLTGAVSDLNMIDYHDIEINRSNYYAELRSKNQTKMLINSNKRNYTIDGVRTKDLTVHSGTDLENGSTELTILLPDKTEKYEVINPDGKGSLDLSMNYDHYYMVANSSKCDNAEFDPNGGVSINGNEADFIVSLTGNDGYISLPWYTIAVGGSGTTNPMLTKSDNGYVFEGDNLKNITVTGRNDEETKELTFTTTEDKVLIGKNDDELTVSIDEDKDGTFETVIAESQSSEESAELTNLETENFTLSPAFAPAIRDYTSSVDYSIFKVALTPTLQNGATATISVNNSTPVDFSHKQTVDLAVGKNTIEIVVSATGLASSKYTITIDRSQSSSDENTLQTDDKPNSSTQSPQTGDTSNILLWVTLLLASSVGLTVTSVYARKKRVN